ncbi:MAG: hypothetical protein ACMVO3_07085 [Thalassobaculum sp.]
MHPFYVVRVFGGVLYLAGGLVMVFNIAMTMQATRAERTARSATALGRSPPDRRK